MALRKILIADDNDMNRKLLKRMLSDEYEILEARDGAEAYEQLQSGHESISAVLLDLIMPKMDGYEVLQLMNEDGQLSMIPVIVTTGSAEEGAEVRALQLGAKDYVLKPYNMPVIRSRLRNTINLRENAALANMSRYDRLTGLYNRETFFEKAGKLIEEKEAGYFVLSCLDVDNFKVINDQYGSKKGDECLKIIADCLLNGLSDVDIVCSRIMADTFAILYPCRLIDTPEIVVLHHKLSILDGSIPPIKYSIGRYIVDDKSLNVSAMYDRASMAERSVKGRFDTSVGMYDESMRASLLKEQEIVSEMKRALEAGHFEVWLQPQYNHSSRMLVGAEALVRWNHPTKGLIPPGEFIPIFEQNGFIYEMDKFVWRQVCSLLRRWTDAGIKPLPIAVNISRYDIFREDLVEVITGLVAEYQIPVELLRLEITESAFANSADRIINVVKTLIACGFTLEIDDFGSGYSSLNTLKDVPADVLKLDMRFLENSENASRGGNILESIVRMSKWIGMSVIAEGVETKEQADYLESIGCNYIQGYLYARPIRVQEYEKLFAQSTPSTKPEEMEQLEALDGNAFWNPESLETRMFNSYVGAACIFEFSNGTVELLRANPKAVECIAGREGTVNDALDVKWTRHTEEASKEEMKRQLESAIRTRAERSCELSLRNMPGARNRMLLRVTFRMISHVGDHYMFYCLLEDRTALADAVGGENE